MQLVVESRVCSQGAGGQKLLAMPQAVLGAAAAGQRQTKEGASLGWEGALAITRSLTPTLRQHQHSYSKDFCGEIALR